jgi:hypothetical protein
MQGRSGPRRRAGQLGRGRRFESRARHSAGAGSQGIRFRTLSERQNQVFARRMSTPTEPTGAEPTPSAIAATVRRPAALQLAENRGKQSLKSTPRPRLRCGPSSPFTAPPGISRPLTRRGATFAKSTPEVHDLVEQIKPALAAVMAAPLPISQPSLRPWRRCGGVHGNTRSMRSPRFSRRSQPWTRSIARSAAPGAGRSVGCRLITVKPSVG